MNDESKPRGRAAGVLPKLLFGVLIGLVASAGAAAVSIASGAIDMAAGRDEDAIDWVGRRMVASSLARRAPDAINPLTDRAAASDAGYEHYRDTCVLCHGAPDVPPAEFAEGLAPRAPALDSEAVQSRTDGELFYLIESGVRMTAMPAFGENHTDREIWECVAFIRGLDRITDAQRAVLREATVTHEHGDETGASAGHETGGSAGHEHGTEPPAPSDSGDSGQAGGAAAPGEILPLEPQEVAPREEHHHDHRGHSH